MSVRLIVQDDTRMLHKVIISSLYFLSIILDTQILDNDSNYLINFTKS